MVTLQCDPIKIGNNIRHINLYKSGTKDEDINLENMCDNVNI